MFFISLPATTRIGDTVECSINDEPASVTWRDAKTLVIEPDDAREILEACADSKLLSFICGNSVDEPGGPYSIITVESEH